MSSSPLSEESQADFEPVDLSALKKPIVLIGLMGAGKTSIGKRLAKVIGWQFVDSDAEIEEAAACSISDIFAVHGEGIFRDLEQRVIHRLLDASNIVLATGGGAWMQPAVRQAIKDKAVSVWLKADLDVLLDRVERRNHRPLLEQGDKREILQELMEARYPVYAQADLTIPSDHAPHEKVVDALIQSLLDSWAK